MRALVAFIVLGSATADAGTISGTVNVTRPEGVEAGPILIYVVGFKEPATESDIEIRQKGKRFAPELVGLTAGQSVTFPNGDPFLHNVFSPTEARRFDLGSYEPGQTRTRTELALVGPGGAFVGHVPAALVEHGRESDLDRIDEISVDSAAWLVQRYPLIGPEGRIADIVVARETDAGLGTLFPHARGVLIGASIVLLLMVIAGFGLARRRDLTRRIRN